MIEFLYENFADDTNFPIHIQYGFHDDDLYTHSHKDFSELVIVLDGKADHVVNGENYPISRGDVFVINHSTEHGFSVPERLKICNIMFRPEEAFSDTYDIKQLAGFQALFVLEPHYSRNYGFCSQLKLNSAEYSETESVIDCIMNEYTNKLSGWKDMVFYGFRRLCTMLSRFYRTEKAKSENDFFKLADAVAYIENNFCNQITLESLARISGYSERQFLRIFRSAFSTTPNLYISVLRTKKAEHLLETTNLSIGEVAYRCGFTDHNYFSRFFRKTTGLSPSEYRSALNRR